MTDTTSALALKKQLLLTRAAIERAEMVRAIGSASQSAAVLGRGWSGLTGLANLAGYLKLGTGLPLVLGLVKKARLLSPLLPLLFAGARRPVVQRRSWFSILKYTLLGAGSVLVIWKSRHWLAGLADRFGPSADSDYY
ncbi:MAG: hypothetical protein V4772_07505 [Pseudomonadota bacterium]